MLTTHISRRYKNKEIKIKDFRWLNSPNKYREYVSPSSALSESRKITQSKHIGYVYHIEKGEKKKEKRHLEDINPCIFDLIFLIQFL